MLCEILRIRRMEFIRCDRDKLTTQILLKTETIAATSLNKIGKAASGEKRHFNWFSETKS